MIVIGMSPLDYPEFVASVVAMVSREIVTTLVRSLGVQEWIVLLIVAILFFGPRSPRQAADDLARGIREFQQVNARRPARSNTAEDLLLLAIVIAACLLVFWIVLG